MSDQYPPQGQPPQPYSPPTQAQPAQAWGQQPAPSYSPQGQPPQQPPYQPPYSPTPGGPGGPGGPRKTPWPLVVGALVLGLVLGGGVGFGIAAATSGDDDPTESSEYQDLEDELAATKDDLAAAEDGGDEPAEPEPSAEEPEPAEPAEPSTSAAPESESGTRDVEGWTVTEPEVTKDFVDDFTATFNATNDTSAEGVAIFTVTLLQGGTTVTSMTCIGNDGDPVPAGDSAEMQCITSDDFIENGWDTVDITYDGF